MFYAAWGDNDTTTPLCSLFLFFVCHERERPSHQDFLKKVILDWPGIFQFPWELRVSKSSINWLFCYSMWTLSREVICIGTTGEAQSPKNGKKGKKVLLKFQLSAKCSSTSFSQVFRILLRLCRHALNTLFSAILIRMAASIWLQLRSHYYYYKFSWEEESGAASFFLQRHSDMFIRITKSGCF